MALPGTKSPRARRLLLALLLVGVLAAAVAAAWVMDLRARRRVWRAADIMAEIRSRGLGAFWPERAVVEWYLRQDPRGPIGWRATARWATRDGGFAGVDLLIDRSGSGVEQWTLDPSAGRGTYDATAQDETSYSRTQVLLTDGRVQVAQSSGDTAESPEPPNYIPEGLLELVVRRVGQRRTDGLFKIVFNNRPNRYGVVDFGNLHIRHLGTSRAGGPKVRVSSETDGERFQSVYEFDGQGQLAGVTAASGVRSVRSSLQEVGRFFPQAPARLSPFLPEDL